MEDFVQEFNVDVTDMHRTVEKIQVEMAKGLKGEFSSLLMVPSYTDIPEGNESGIFLAIGFILVFIFFDLVCAIFLFY
jgi:hexokinase